MKRPSYRSRRFPSKQQAHQEPDLEVNKPQNNVPAQLEDQLAKVVEQDGLTISVSTPVLPRHVRRTRKGLKIEPTIHNQETIGVPISTSSSPDHAQQFDLDLVRHLQPKPKPSPIKKVDVRFGEHVASPHFVEIGGLAQRVDDEKRIDEGGTIHAWVAPYEEQITLEGLTSYTEDLFISEVDPRLIHEQFTPGDAQVAYQERYSLWAKLRAPFVRWEATTITVSDESTEEVNAGHIFDLPEIMPVDVRAIEIVAPEAEIVHPAPVEPEPIMAMEAAEPIETESEPQSTVGERVNEAAHTIWRRAEEGLEHLRNEEEEMITQVERSWRVPVLLPKLDFMRVMAGFIGLMVLVSLPAGAVSLSRSFGASVKKVEQQSREALAHVKAAMSNGPGTSETDTSWQQAASRFQSAEQQLNQANSFAVAIANALPQTRDLYQSAQALLLAGNKVSQAGRALNEGFSKAIGEPGLRADERLLAFSTRLDLAAPLLEDALTAIGQVNARALPSDLRPEVERLQSVVSSGRETIRDMQSLTKFMVDAVGNKEQRRYLVIFQNHTELRPTGGFMGSLAEVTLDRGEIKNILVPGGGPYDLRSQLTERVLPPKPLQLIASRWEFQDANWFPDYPASADKIRWFWSKSGQPTVDGVVAINATLMEKLLTVTGPIEMPEYGKTITADNFMLETQKQVELEYDKDENKPKKFIGDLMPKLMDKIFKASKSDWLKYFALMQEALITKDIQVSMTREDEQALMYKLGWSGRMLNSEGDSLALIEANIAGQKTDAVIDEQVEHTISVADDGSITDTVKLTRTHNGQKGELFSGVNNVSYLRVYVPQGAQLLSADGLAPPPAELFKKPNQTDAEDADVNRLVKNEHAGTDGITITEEFGKTAFGGWIQLGPGQTAVTTFTYKLPFTVYDLAHKLNPAQTQTANARAAYMVLYGSQSGKPNRSIKTTFRGPSSWQPAWSNATQAAGSLTYQASWDRDHVVAGLFNTSNP